MTRALCLLLSLVAALGPGCAWQCYEAGAVRRVEVQRQASEPVLSHAEARWADHREYEFTSLLAMTGGRMPDLVTNELQAPVRVLQVGLFRTSQVQLSRQRHFTTIEWEADYHPLFPLWEVLELATCPLYLLIIPPLAIAGIAPPEAPHFRSTAYARLLVATAPINPCVSMFGVTVRRRECVPEEVFQEDPTRLDYELRTPAQGEPVRWRLLDRQGQPLASGEGRTDPMGDVTVAVASRDPLMLSRIGAWAAGRKAGAAALPGVGREDVAAVELEAGGQRVRVAVPPAPEESPEERAAREEAARKHAADQAAGNQAFLAAVEEALLGLELLLEAGLVEQAAGTAEDLASVQGALPPELQARVKATLARYQAAKQAAPR